MAKDEILKLYYQYRFIIYPVLIGIVSLLLIVLLIAPQVVTYLGNQQALKQSLGRYEKLSVKASILQNINEADLKNKTEIAVAVLPEEKDYARILGLIQNIAAQSGFSIINFQIGTPFTNSSTRASGFSVKIDLSGPKDSFKSLLASIEGNSQILKLGSIEINNPRSVDRAEGILTIDTYYAPLPKSIGSVDAQLPELSSADQETLAKYAKVIAIKTSTISGTLTPRGKSNPFE